MPYSDYMAICCNLDRIVTDLYANCKSLKLKNMEGNPITHETAMGTVKNKKRNSIVLKGLIVLSITGILQIPILLLSGLIEDRKELSGKVKYEVTTSWGTELGVNVPELCCPFYKTTVDKEGKSVRDYKVRKLRSHATTVDAKADVEVLHRSIYDIPVYKADLLIKGTFNLTENFLDDLNGDIYVTLPICNYKGLLGYPSVILAGNEYHFSVHGDELRAVIPTSILKASTAVDYELKVKTKGIDRITFSPLGCDYKVRVESNYGDPSFNGDFLPYSREITEDGFTAEWEVTALNVCNSKQANFAVDFIVTADQYQQTERAMKYSFLFFILILTGIFLIESITKSKINIVQYIVTGLSLCLFYLLLLSISEYLPFGLSYLIAAAMTTGALGGYFYGFLKSKVALAFTLGTGILYAYIYMILQMESGALLFGSLALFVILSVVMYFTRNQAVFEPEQTIEE